MATKRLTPSDCFALVEVEGPMAPGTIGFGLTDTKGQWGGVRRVDTVPDWNSFLDRSIGLPTILERTTLSAKHSGANVTSRSWFGYDV